MSEKYNLKGNQFSRKATYSVNFPNCSSLEDNSSTLLILLEGVTKPDWPSRVHPRDVTVSMASSCGKPT